MSSDLMLPQLLWPAFSEARGSASAKKSLAFEEVSYNICPHFGSCRHIGIPNSVRLLEYIHPNHEILRNSFYMCGLTIVFSFRHIGHRSAHSWGLVIRIVQKAGEMLKVTIKQAESTETWELEGKLSGDWVKELERCWKDRVPTAGFPLQVHLKAVSYIDPAGKQLLTEMHGRGVEIRGCGCMTKAVVDEITRHGNAN